MRPHIATGAQKNTLQSSTALLQRTDATLQAQPFISLHNLLHRVYLYPVVGERQRSNTLPPTSDTAYCVIGLRRSNDALTSASLMQPSPPEQLRTPNDQALTPMMPSPAMQFSATEVQLVLDYRQSCTLTEVPAGLPSQSVKASKSLACGLEVRGSNLSAGKNGAGLRFRYSLGDLLRWGKE